MRPLIVIGNWKMNGSLASNEDWIKTVARGMERGMPAGRQFVVCPPFPYLAQCDALIKEHSLAFLSLGAQDASAYASGAYTGEVAASMLKEMGCSYVIVGHSERRQIHHEVDEIVASKALQILDNGMTPVICVGETADERNSGRATEVVCAQVAKQVNVLQDRLADCLIAYEQKKIPLHAYIWVRFNGEVDDDSSKVESELLPDKSVLTIFPSLVVRTDEDQNLIVQYILTTPGRILFNLILMVS